MIRPTRRIAQAAQSQWRLASSSSRASRPPPKPPTARTGKQPRHATLPHKPSRARQPRTAPPVDDTPPPRTDTLQSLWRANWLPLTGAAVVAGFLGFYIIGTVAASARTCPCSDVCDDATPTGRPPALTGDGAERFDKGLNWSEWWMGITTLRKRLAEQAEGHVLELAIGTGRNMEYYDWSGVEGEEEEAAAATVKKTGKGVTSRGLSTFTGLDISADMLEVARRKLAKVVPPMASSEPVAKASTMADHTGGQLSYLNDRLRLVNSDAHRTLPLPCAAARPRASAAATAAMPSPSAKYDTIIQTFGLCSVSDPVAVLSNLASVVKPDTGRILLLEHGRGWYGLVNGLLDKNANKHFEKYGCWWNRDIEALVEAAARATPGLEVVKVERPNLLQMGTLVWVELRVRNNASE